MQSGEWCLTWALVDKFTSKCSDNINTPEQPTLDEFLCEGNPNLRSAPVNMRGNSKLLIWSLEMQQKYLDVVEPKTNQRDELQQRSNQLQSDILSAQGRIQRLQNDIARLEVERPDGYIYWKRHIMTVLTFVANKLLLLWSFVKNTFLAWRDRRQTYPLYWLLSVTEWAITSIF